MNEEQVKTLAGDLRNAAAVRAARESLEKARASAEEDDTKTSVQQAHDALEGILHEICSHLVSHELRQVGLVREVVSRGTYKLTRTGWAEANNLD